MMMSQDFSIFLSENSPHEIYFNVYEKIENDIFLPEKQEKFQNEEELKLFVFNFII